MKLLDNWDTASSRFVKVVPNDYKKMVDKIQSFKDNGLTDDAAAMQAFLATSNGLNKETKVLAKK